MESPAMKQAKKYASELKFDNPRLSSDEIYGRREDAKEDFYAGAVWGLGVEMPAHLKTHGTITWYKCDEILPPSVDKNAISNCSETVIVTDGIDIRTTYYVRSVHETNIGWMGQNTIPFNPTHWAYINYPEQ